MFPHITYWALKLIRLTEACHSMFFDPKFLSYSALKKYIYSGQLRPTKHVQQICISFRCRRQK